MKSAAVGAHDIHFTRLARFLHREVQVKIILRPGSSRQGCRGGKFRFVAAVNIGNPEFHAVVGRNRDVHHSLAITGNCRLCCVFRRNVRGSLGGNVVQRQDSGRLAVHQIKPFPRGIGHGRKIRSSSKRHLRQRLVLQSKFPNICQAADGSAEINGLPGFGPRDVGNSGDFT